MKDQTNFPPEVKQALGMIQDYRTEFLDLYQDVIVYYSLHQGSMHGEKTKDMLECLFSSMKSILLHAPKLPPADAGQRS